MASSLSEENYAYSRWVDDRVHLFPMTYQPDVVLKPRPRDFLGFRTPPLAGVCVVSPSARVVSMIATLLANHKLVSGTVLCSTRARRLPRYRRPFLSYPACGKVIVNSTSLSPHLGGKGRLDRTKVWDFIINNAATYLPQ